MEIEIEKYFSNNSTSDHFAWSGLDYTEIDLTNNLINKTDVSLTSENFNQSLSSLNFGNCRICDDRASGIHYGLATCEGCKVIIRISNTNIGSNNVFLRDFINDL